MPVSVHVRVSAIALAFSFYSAALFMLAHNLGHSDGYLLAVRVFFFGE